jgi:hypothetical protein
MGYMNTNPHKPELNAPLGVPGLSAISAQTHWRGLPRHSRFLLRFKCFCSSEEARSSLDCAIRDIWLDQREMLSLGFGRTFVASCIWWRTIFGVVLPIAADGIWRIIKPTAAKRLK